MKIKILGPGCKLFQQTRNLIREAIAEAGVAAEIEEITEDKEIEKYRIAGTPAVLIDGKVKSVGQIPKKEDIEKWIRN